MKGKWIKATEGGISLILAITIFWTSTIAVFSYRYAYIRAEESKLNRLLDLSLKQAMASYDRELLERYGLWGLEEGLINNSFFESGLKQSYLLESFDYKACDQLEDEVLYEQILTFSKSRVLTEVLSELFTRLKGIEEAGELVSDSGLRPRIESMRELLDLNPSVKPQGYLNKAHLLPSIWGESGTSGKEEGDSKEADDEEKEKALNQIEKMQNQVLDAGKYSQDILPEGDLFTADSTKGILEELLNYLDRGINLMQFNVGIGTEAFIFHEYVLSQFHSLARGPKAIPEKGKDYVGLNGRKLSEYDYSEMLEAEKILLGFDNSFITLSRLIQMLFSTRLVFRYLPEIVEENRFAIHKANAALLSQAIAVLTLGYIVIEPEVLAYIVAIFPAIPRAAMDVKKLLQGEEVPVYPVPGHSLAKLKVNYIDHLRVFAFITPHKRKLEMTSRYIKKNMGKTYYCTASFIFSVKNGRAYEKEVSYLENSFPHS